jgi:uncharacterized protein (TIGR03118 family)
LRFEGEGDTGGRKQSFYNPPGKYLKISAIFVTTYTVREILTMSVPSVGRWLTAALVLPGILVMPLTIQAANTYIEHNLVSDIAGLADHTDSGLINPWGICTSPTSPFWFSDQGSGLSTLYSTAGSGSIPATRVTIPPVGGATVSSPTGCIWQGTTGFQVASGKSASFIFDTEDGSISGWNSSVNASQAIIMVDNSKSGAVYKGLALGVSGGNSYLFAANFNAGTIEVYDNNFKPVTLAAGAFTDAAIPPGFAPFNVQNLGGSLYVTYAKQDSTKKVDVAGPGNGYVDVYDTAGNLQHRLIAQGHLNSPWGVAIAPSGFGDFAGDLLVGNFGDGLINVYTASSGAYVATLQGTNGSNIVLQGLWALQAGNGGNGGDPHAVYFTAGIPGPSGQIQSHGLFGSLQAAPALTTSSVLNGASFQAGIAPNMFVTITGQNLSSTTRSWAASDFVNGALPTSLDNVSVMIDGKPAYVAYISPSQLNVITPFDTTQGPVQVQTSNKGVTSGMVSAQMSALDPAFFLFKTGPYIAAIHGDGTDVGPTSLFPNASTPAQAGETISLYGTGFGPTPPNYASGQTLTGALSLSALPTVTIGGAPAAVTFAGLVSPGLYQINVTVPASTPSGDAQVIAQIGGASTPAASINVQ